MTRGGTVHFRAACKRANQFNRGMARLLLTCHPGDLAMITSSRERASPCGAAPVDARAAALVEGLFCRAGYQTASVSGTAEDGGPIRIGGEWFGPRFLAWRYVAVPGSREPLQRLLAVEVHYRADVDGFLERVGQVLFPHVAQRWPDLCVILITDRPAAGRSCFQAIDLRHHEPGARLSALDLATVRRLDVSPALVAEYEPHVRGAEWSAEQGLLPGASRRKPPGKLAGRPSRAPAAAPARAGLSAG